MEASANIEALSRPCGITNLQRFDFCEDDRLNRESGSSCVICRMAAGEAWRSLFFIGWVFLGGFVVLNLFVGVLMDVFAKVETQERWGAIFSSHQQQAWVETLDASVQVHSRARQGP